MSLAQEKLDPCSKVAIDLFIVTEKHDVIVIDSYFHFPKIALLEDAELQQMSVEIKSFSASPGTPDTAICG